MAMIDILTMACPDLCVELVVAEGDVTDVADLPLQQALGVTVPTWAGSMLDIAIGQGDQVNS